VAEKYVKKEITWRAVGQVSCNGTWPSTVLQWIGKSVMSRNKTGGGGHSWVLFMW